MGYKLAEREGFEPSVPRKEYTGLAVQHLQPLSHLSALKWSEEDSLAPHALQAVFGSKVFAAATELKRGETP